jgi:hypothetical protein
MSQNQDSPKVLPLNPSAEYLRKAAKRLARKESIQLAAAQRQLAHDYGHRNWGEFMKRLLSMSPSAPREGDSRNDRSQKPQPPPEAEGTGGVLPLVPLRELIAFPHVVYPIIAGRAKTMKAILTAKKENISGRPGSSKGLVSGRAYGGRPVYDRNDRNSAEHRPTARRDRECRD